MNHPVLESEVANLERSEESALTTIEPFRRRFMPNILKPVLQFFRIDGGS
jgi:hypothetical protein